jgi:hypothetical protein
MVGLLALACGEDDGARPEEPACPTGEIWLRTPEDVEAIAHCEELGEVWIELEAAGGVALPALERVNGILLLGNVTSLDVPALESCTGLYSQSRELSLVAAPALRSSGIYLAGPVPGTSLELPSLEVSSDLQLHGDWAVLSLPQLRSVEHELDVAGVDTLHAPLLREVGNLVLLEGTGAKGLGSLSLPALEVVSGRIVMTNRGDGTIFPEHQIASVDLPLLRQVGDLVFAGGEVLPSLSLPALERVEGGLSVAAFPALASLDLPRLAYVGTHFGVTGNESLPACEVDAVVQQLVAAGAPCTFEVGGNGPECQ